MNNNLKMLVNVLKREFPLAEYKESDAPELEDDEIFLTDNLSLQVVNDNEFGITRLSPFSIEYVSRNELFKALEKY